MAKIKKKHDAEWKTRDKVILTLILVLIVLLLMYIVNSGRWDMASNIKNSFPNSLPMFE